MRILCFGDSNTYGYDPRDVFGGRYDAENRWIDLLAVKTGHTVINAGVNARSIPCNPDVLRLFVRHAPVDILLVMLGTNDLLQGASGSVAAARMETFLLWAMPHCKQVLLISPPPMKRGAWVPSDSLVCESIRLTEAYQHLGEKLGIPFVDTRQWGIELAFDGVHFSEAGHRTFAECLQKELL